MLDPVFFFISGMEWLYERFFFCLRLYTFIVFVKKKRVGGSEECKENTV